MVTSGNAVRIIYRASNLLSDIVSFFSRQALGFPEEVRFSHRRAASPPPFMLDLYDSVADGRGRWRAPTPYDANVVRSLRETGEE